MIMKKINDQGSALILVVFTMLIVFFLGFTLLEISTMDFAMANNQIDGAKAYYIAEAGMNKAIATLRYDQNVQLQILNALKNPGNTMTLTIMESFGGGNFSDVLITLKGKTSQNMIIELNGSGTFNKAKREIACQAKLNFNQGQMNQFMASDTAIICITRYSMQGNNFIDGNIYSFGGIEGAYDAEVKGDVFGYGTVKVNNAIITGSLYGTNDVTVEHSNQGLPINISGDITGRGKITIFGGNRIGGNVFAFGAVEMLYDSEVKGSLKTLNNLKLNGKNKIGGDIYSFGTIDISNNTQIVGSLFGAKDLIINGTIVKGSLHGGKKVTLTNASTIEGNLTASNGIELEYLSTVKGGITEIGYANISGSQVTVDRDFYCSGNLDIGHQGTFNGNVVCSGNLNNSSTSISFNKSVFGDVVEFAWGTKVKEKVYYISKFTDNSQQNNKSKKIGISEMPVFPEIPPFPTAPTPPEIKIFPGIPEVKITDYKDQPGTKTIKETDLTSKGLNLATLTPGVYYVDEKINELKIFGKYSGVIQLVSKGKITVIDDVTRTDEANDALMILSFKTSDSIYVNYQKIVEALVFAPVGEVSTASQIVLKGGAMGNIVKIGHAGKVYHIESILNKFGLGNTGVGIESIEIINWREKYGML